MRTVERLSSVLKCFAMVLGKWSSVDNDAKPYASRDNNEYVLISAIAPLIKKVENDSGLTCGESTKLALAKGLLTVFRNPACLAQKSDPGAP